MVPLQIYLTAVVAKAELDRGVIASVCDYNLYATFTLGIFFDSAGSRKLAVPSRSRCFPRLRSRCGAVPVFGLGGHLSWQLQEIGAILHFDAKISWHAQH